MDDMSGDEIEDVDNKTIIPDIEPAEPKGSGNAEYEQMTVQELLAQATELSAEGLHVRALLSLEEAWLKQPPCQYAFQHRSLLSRSRC